MRKEKDCAVIFEQFKQSKKICFLMQATLSCNLNCRYCYVGKKEKRNGKKMKPAVFKELLTKTVKNYRSIEFVWLGGEPLLMSPDFYREIFKIQKSIVKNKNVKIQHNIQSNGTLINQDFVKLAKDFKDRGFSISFSFDGPWQNVMRGPNTEKILLKNIKIFNDKVGKIDAISMISALNYDKTKELTEFLKLAGINSFSINPISRSGNAIKMKEKLLLKSGMYARSVIDVAKLLIEVRDKKKIDCTTLSYFFSSLLNKKNVVCSLGYCLGNFLNVNSNGQIGHCHVFKVPYANLKEINSITDIYEKPLFLKHKKMIQKRLDNCRNCEWYNNCFGGCYEGIYRYNNKNYEFCEDNKKIFTYFENLLEEKLKEVKLDKKTADVLLKADKTLLRLLPWNNENSQKQFRNKLQNKETKLISRYKKGEIIKAGTGYYDLTKVKKSQVGEYLFEIIQQEIA